MCSQELIPTVLSSFFNGDHDDDDDDGDSNDDGEDDGDDDDDGDGDVDSDDDGDEKALFLEASASIGHFRSLTDCRRISACS